ncbi:TetR/AcrR family transcriptional regulator [Sphingobium tyrosinilyticum]|uniref:TetR/AcrR family transcriptional regulator n=1 Tax=Sphingobium tyrosinilyticum TaxID=2715436 RepID=A0ABV9F1R9_9SPHN
MANSPVDIPASLSVLKRRRGLHSQQNERLPKEGVPEGPSTPRSGRGRARQRLLKAAAELFCTHGYLPVTVEDIATAAGVTRVTFYRQFSDKAALTADLFREMTDRVLPRYAQITRLDYRDPIIVQEWISDIFESDRAYPGLLRAFTQALVTAPNFLARAQGFTDRLIDVLGAGIPAFAANREEPTEKRQWMEAWMLLYEILDQSNHAALQSGIATDPLMIDILADRFVEFVARYQGGVSGGQSRVARCVRVDVGSMGMA